MKKLFLFLFLALTLFADEKSVLQAQILERIFQNISIKEKIMLWSDNENLLQEFAKNRHFHTTNDYNKATLIVLEDKKNLPKGVCQKAIFVLEYALLKEMPQSFGAMFWKKGRPNIVLIESRAQTHSIQIGKGLEMYTEEKIW